MKLLIDQNISHRLKAKIVSAFQDAFHSTEVHDILEVFSLKTSKILEKTPLIPRNLK